MASEKVEKNAQSKMIRDNADIKQDDDEKKDTENAAENVDFVSKIFASGLNKAFTSIGKFALNWLVWNTEDNIYWNFDLSHLKNDNTKYIAFTMDDSPGLGLNGTIEFLDFLKELDIQITFFLISSMIRDQQKKELDPEAQK